MAAGLDGDGGTGWQSLVTHLFGAEPSRGGRAPGRAALSVRPARLRPALRAALSGRPRLLEAVTFVKPGVRIDPASGRALDRHLRFEEQARCGSVLEAQVRLGAPDRPLDDPTATAAEALLVAGARFVERLGGNRRRGSGRCTFELAGAEDPGPWLDWLAESDPPPVPGNHGGTGVTQAPAGGAARATGRGDTVPGEPVRGGSWLVYPVTVRALTPILAPDRVRGNVGLSLDVVPGTLLLGALGRALAARGIDLAEHLRAGELIVTDLVPSPDGSPAHPAPLTLARPKGGDDATIYNRLTEAPSESVQIKPVRRGVVTDDAPHQPTVPARMAVTHATIDDDRQRPTSEVGGVFTYEALPEGTLLTGELRVRGTLAEQLAAGDEPPLPERVELGRSKKDDYGLAEVTIGPAVTPTTARHPERYESGDQLVVWLWSDALLVDGRHRPTPSVAGLQATLEAALGCRLEHPEPPGGLITAAVEPVRRESWHATWGLPRGALVGLKGGSVVVFELCDPVDGAKVAELEHAGIGLRTAEGFGQVRINDPALVESVPSDTPAGSAAGSIGTGGGGVEGAHPPLLGDDADRDDLELARTVERAAWRAAIMRASTALVADQARCQGALGWYPTGQASPPSQLGALRQVLAGLETSSGPERARDWLTQLRSVANRRDKWPGRALDALDRLLSDPDAVWLALDLPETELVATPNGAAHQRAELWRFAVRALVGSAVRAQLRLGSGDDDRAAEEEEERG